MRINRVHAFQRAYERYNIKLSKADFGNMNKLIQTGHAKFAKEDRGDNVVPCMVRYKNRKFFVLYDRVAREIKTFLHRNDKLFPDFTDENGNNVWHFESGKGNK